MLVYCTHAVNRKVNGNLDEICKHRQQTNCITKILKDMIIRAETRALIGSEGGGGGGEYSHIRALPLKVVKFQNLVEK